MNNKLYIIGILLLGGVAWLLVSGSTNSDVKNEDMPLVDSVTQDQDIEVDNSSITPVIAVEDATDEGEPVASPLELPDLDRPIKALIPLTKGREEKITEDINKITADLHQNSELITSWLLLGIHRKSLGDYEGAEEIWVYVTKKWPSNYVAYNNLGDLYEEYIKDYPKAEKAFKEVVIKNPGYVPGYVNLSELYRYFYKEKESHAVTVLEQGLVSNPNNIDLMLHIARYYGDTGINLEKAKEYYSMIIEEAEKVGRTDLAANMKAEMEGLGR